MTREVKVTGMRQLLVWHIYTMLCINTMEYYSAMKRNEIGSFAEKWKNLESVIPE